MGSKPIGEIDSLDIQKWHSGFLRERTRDLGKHISTTRGLSAYHRMLQARFNDLVKAKILLDNPLKGLKPKDLKRDVQGRAWTQTEIDQILSAADELTKPKDRRKRSTVLPLLPHFLRIGLSTGLRTDELCDLRWDQILVDPTDEKKKIYFLENDTKTDIAGKVTLSRRVINLLDEINEHYDSLVISSDLKNPDEEKNPFAYNALSHFPDLEPMEAIRYYCIRLFGLPHGQNIFERLNKRPGLTYVFEHGNGRKWTTTNVAHNFKKIIKRAGLHPNGPKRFSPYETRHTFAVHAIKRGLPLSEVQSTLRHQDINLTALYATTDRIDMTVAFRRVVKVERRVVHGDMGRVDGALSASASTTINTAFIERSNLDWRLWDAHLRRKSLTFSKAIRWLRAKFSICVAFYNLIRPHSSLPVCVKGNNYMTPAMAAGLTDHRWTPMELLVYPARCQ
ncbi:MAG: tyrosine-type recombinase/integrase [Bacteroidetes bacterium]|nr:tyrosine-type recombinase/integrase [Bacteroidota bacterium]